MQQFIKPLRTCRMCGLKANNEAELEQFYTSKDHGSGYRNLCKECGKEEKKQRESRTNEFIEEFKKRSSNGYINCYFCGEQIIKLRGVEGDSLYIHSLDGTHENWSHPNKVPTHNHCHTTHHNTGQYIGERNPNWKGDKASDDAKRKRGRPINE